MISSLTVRVAPKPLCSETIMYHLVVATRQYSLYVQPVLVAVVNIDLKKRYKRYRLSRYQRNYLEGAFTTFESKDSLSPAPGANPSYFPAGQIAASSPAIGLSSLRKIGAKVDRGVVVERGEGVGRNRRFTFYFHDLIQRR